MNWLIDHGHFVDRTSGTIVLSYAYPIFSAPFTIVGDGRASARR